MSDGPPITPRPRPALALGLLLCINLFNYIDRQNLSAVLPRIRDEFGWSYAQGGLLTSIFLISYMLFSPVFGWFGDRFSRWKLIAIGVMFWSLASGATGLATTFVMMATTRALIGLGEAAYGPAAPSLIADLYPVEKRGAKLAWFYVAIPVGSALGYMLGGHMAGTWGWRWAFYAVVPPGILLGIICLFMREPSRGLADGVTHRQARFSDYGTLVRTPSYVLCTLGMTAMTFAVGGMAVWIPTFYFERESVYQVQPATITYLSKLEQADTAKIADKVQPLVGQSFKGMDNLREALSKVLTPEEVVKWRTPIAKGSQDEKVADALLGEINYKFGLVVVVTGLAATLAGGWLGDKLRSRISGSYFFVSGAGMLIGLPAFIAAVTVPLPLGWVFVFIGVFFLFFNTGPANTILANVSHPAVRSSAYALNILIIHLFGDVASPPIVGWVGDHYSLVKGMYVLSGAIFISGVLWLWGARYLERDTALAPTRL